MIKYDFKNAKEVIDTKNIFADLIKRVENLDKFSLALELTENIRKLNIEKFKVNFIKDEYDQECLSEGVFVTIQDRTNKNAPYEIVEMGGWEFENCADIGKLKKIKKFKQLMKS